MTVNRLTISDNGRFLIQDNDQPFFWLGDTCWLLFSRLTLEEAEHYLDVRQKQGFNVIQASLVHGLPTKNIFDHQPFVENDISKPVLLGDSDQDGYWEHIDNIITIAEQKGLYMALIPMWGSVVRANKATVEQAKAYGSWLAQRYRDRPNIIWINGGDVRGDVGQEVWNTMGESIKSIDTEHLMTFHPHGRTRSSIWFHDRSWLDFNMFQSGHCRYGQAGMDGRTDHFGPDNWRYVEIDYNMKPIKPTIDGEPSYELIPQGLHDRREPLWQPADVRRYAYWSVFAGAFGHTYGHCSIMKLQPKDASATSFSKPWQDAIFDEGGTQMQHLKSLLLSYPFFDRIPDQSALAGDQGEKYERVQITRGNDFLLAYIYTGRQFSLKMGVIKGNKVKAFWYDPRTGERTDIGELDNTGVVAFDPPGKHLEGNDWVLILESILES